MTERYKWTPLTEAEADEMTGIDALQAQAAGGDPLAALLVKRIDAATEAVQPAIEAMKAEMEREWMEGTPGTEGGLASLIGPPAPR